MIFYRLWLACISKTNKKMKKIVSLLLLVVLFSSCNEYQKALKSEDVSVKYAMADTLYAQAKYSELGKRSMKACIFSIALKVSA